MSEFAYKPGTIKFLKLVNFMCHDSFELSFGPRVNFIIGPNGSGKSALLTALVVVLGGRATTTSRARKNSEFIKYGKNFAKISIVLHNYELVMEKETAFKPDEYGKEVIIEKIIYKDDISKLVLKNHKDKRVSERKSELDELLEHFGIQINNPICILNQEVSKTFLHSKKPEDKYDLFMKATMLEQIEQDHSDATNLHSSWDECNKKKSHGFRLLEAEKTSCKEKIHFLLQQSKMQDRVGKLREELSWAMYHESEAHTNRLQSRIDEIELNLERAEADVVKREQQILCRKSDMEMQQAKVTLCNEECDVSKKKLIDIRSKEFRLKTEKLQETHKLEAERRRKHLLEQERDKLERKIAEERKRFFDEDAVAAESEKRQLEIEDIERKLPHEKAREKNIRQHTEQLNKSILNMREEHYKAKGSISALQTDLSSKQAMLKRLEGGQSNALRKYGELTIRICEEINRAHQSGRFKRKPLGPLGYFIKLKTPEVAGPLEVHLGRNAHAFVCDNRNDMKVLEHIVSGLNRRSSGISGPYRAPLIIVRPFGPKHDVSRYRSATEKYLTMLDHIEIDDDAVFNALVDRTALENILYISDYKEAENLMMTPSLVPSGTRCAYTRDCSVMYPYSANKGFKVNAPSNQNLCLFSKGDHVQIEQTKDDIRQIEQRLVDAQQAADRINVNLTTQREEYNNNLAEARSILDELRKLEQRMLELRTAQTAPPPQGISVLEEVLSKTLEKLVAIDVTIGEISVRITKLEQDNEEIQREKESVMKILSQREKERQVVQQMVSSEKNVIKTHEVEIGISKKRIQDLQKEREEIEAKKEENLNELEIARRELRDIRKPDTVRTTAEIKEEQKSLQRKLNVEIEENTDPAELIARLQTRRDEISNLEALKTLNYSNFALSSEVLKERADGFKVLRTHTVGNVSKTFASVMRAMGMNGLLRIHISDEVSRGDIIAKAKTLEMQIDPTPSQRPCAVPMADNNAVDDISRTRMCHSQPGPYLASDGPSRSKRSRLEQEKENTSSKMTDTRSLSGGERSFSTVAFVLALWHHCASPFKLMDEIDVFMDMVTRRLSYNALIKFAHITDNPGQFVFFSPLELPQIDSEKTGLVRVFEMPQIIRKTSATQPNTSRSLE